MRLVVLGSSSKGNCYLLENDKECLMIECGVGAQDIKRALGFTFNKVAGCILTHEHGDHAKSAKEVMSWGINLYASRGTMSKLAPSTTGHRFKPLSAGTVQRIGNFSVLPFAVQHDCEEPLGFVIRHQECGSVLFITDSYYVKDTFKNINHVIIEANFSNEIVHSRMKGGYMPDFRAKRLFSSHMSLETCEKTLRANDLSQVQNIVLIHLSDGNSDADKFKQKIEACTGKKVTIADTGLIIENFNRKPF